MSPIPFVLAVSGVTLLLAGVSMWFIQRPEKPKAVHDPHLDSKLIGRVYVRAGPGVSTDPMKPGVPWTCMETVEKAITGNMKDPRTHVSVRRTWIWADGTVIKNEPVWEWAPPIQEWGNPVGTVDVGHGPGDYVP